MFEDVEIAFGSERVLSHETAALEQATTTARFALPAAAADAEQCQALSAGGRRPLPRDRRLGQSQRRRADGTTAGDPFADGEADHERFMAYYDLNEERSDPVAADLLVIAPGRPDEPTLAVADEPVEVANVPCIPGLIEMLAENADDPPDLLRLSSEALGELLGEALDGLPSWATPIGINEVDQLKDKPLLDLLDELVEQDSERVSANRSAGELVVHLGGDHHQAARFEKLVPAQALKGRFADVVKLDLAALDQEYGFDVGPRARHPVLARLLRH